MINKIEDIFLTYANIPLNREPENLEKVFDVAQEYYEISSTESISNLIELIKKVDNFNNREEADAAELYRQPLNKDYDDGIHNYDDYLEWAIDSIWWRKGCDDCFDFAAEIRRHLLKKNDIDKPRCYLCWQLFFNFILSKISNGTEYSDIFFPEFESLAKFRDTLISGLFESCFYDASQCLSRQIEIVNVEPEYPFREALKIKWIWNVNLVEIPDINSHVFNLAVVSLCEFLLKSDRRKLKFCPFCNNFFIAGDIRRTRCYSKECEKAYQRYKKRKQRENDPAKYV